MEGLNYSELVQRILKHHVENRLNSKTEVHLIFDTERDRYQLLQIGWEDLIRVFGCIIYVAIKDGKIWIERDGTEIGFANELVEAGVPKQDIVLAFKAPYRRKFTEFAVGWCHKCDRVFVARESEAISEGDRYLLMLVLRTVAKGKVPCQNKTSLISSPSNRVNLVLNLVFEGWELRFMTCWNISLLGWLIKKFSMIFPISRNRIFWLVWVSLGSKAQGRLALISQIR